MRKSLVKFLLLSALFSSAACVATAAQTEITLNALPLEGRETYQKIIRGGPFPYEKDGTVFGNRERLLPRAQRGYYREYTVKTPGKKNRGARRIVCGEAPSPPKPCYYTDDHYASFRKIVP